MRNMTYIFKENIPIEEYQTFIKNSSLVSFMQDYGWGLVKENWKAIRTGLYQEDKLVAVALVLIKKVVGNLHMAYVPRGYVMDFMDKEVVKEFTNGIKELGKREKCYVVKIDPYFCNQEVHFLSYEKKESIEIPIIFSKDYQNKHDYLLSLGYRHTGFVKEFDKTFQPRYHMMVPLVNSMLSPLSDEEMLKSFQKRTRSYIGNYHEKRGVFYEYTSNKEQLDEFVQVLRSTESRQGIHLRNKHYFELIMDYFQERAVLFFGKLDLQVYLDFLKHNQGKEEEIQEVEKLLANGSSVLTLSAALVIMPSNQTGIRVSEYLYAGNELLFSKLQISAGLIFSICQYSLAHGCSYVNLGGVDGHLEDHLTKFKARFGAILTEFIGEYDLPIYPIRYRLITHFMPILKKGYKLIKR